MDERAGQSHSSIPGARLAAAREQAGMTLTEVAERLRLDVATLQALEAGRFESLGAAVFVRGHLRHYAELVGLPLEEIEAAYAASAARLAPQPDLRRTTTLPGTSASRGVALPPWRGADRRHRAGAGRLDLVGDARARGAAPRRERARCIELKLPAAGRAGSRAGHRGRGRRSACGHGSCAAAEESRKPVQGQQRSIKRASASAQSLIGRARAAGHQVQPGQLDGDL